ncbi:L-serine ammonia-lyase, iron-sulfur-dependent, subunit alpha [Gelria sp. Kuro-4]|uniref:L-serine ammonia-lyase, iron-sulfur-dependent, subunit alpha n=1 Tax=Gelria sp. Kuro-4 TaxID=2796927 RepID=UPI001BEE49F2|nr:L-serine ammonia-lyase, iron-sulfur-dependent, subunit alpha [Gelria sp. Kuro-4]BCV23378.1 L-serine dehydratase, iron-sulfur-dependent subunit alpha [Gelria sp. Kuro-4]
MLTFASGAELLALAERENLSLGTLALRWESEQERKPEAELKARMAEYLAVMRAAVERGLTGKDRSPSGLAGGRGRLVWEASGKARVGGATLARAAARALAVAEVNACMGRIVAAPTAGSCGIVPGVLFTVAEENHKDDEALVLALFTAGVIGQLIARRATLAGAAGGCQAECGAAAGMAAAAAVELAGGSPGQALAAAAISLKGSLGLVCDPVAGLVEVPCIKRNALGAANALTSAELALAGVESAVPFDEVVDAMAEVGRSLPREFKETALGGCAATPTGRAWKEKLCRPF